MSSISTFLEMLRSHSFALTYTMAAKFIIHLVMLLIIFTWMDINVSAKKTVICSLCSMLLEVFPIIIANILIADPLEARILVYRLFMYTNPLYCAMCYIVIRLVLKFSPTRAIIIMHYKILISYGITTFLLFFNDFFCYVFNIESSSDKFLPPDYLSYLIIVVAWLLVWRAVKAFLKKNRWHLIVPPSYADKNIGQHFVTVILTICLLYLITIFFRINWIPEVSNPITFTTGLIYFLILCAIFFFFLNTTAQLRNRLLDWQMQATGTYISSLLHTNQEFRAIKHDFYNVLQGYGGYLSIKDYDGLEKYHNKLFATTKQAGDFLSIIDVLRSRIAVYSLLETMSEKAKNVGVLFSINNICDVTDIILDDMDLCRILGIVIDNAIEEAQLSADKQVNLSFERKDENTIVLVVSNTTSKNVDTQIIFKDGYTTKADHTGIGLPQVLHILNKYEHCFLRVNYHDNQFTTFLILNADATAKP